MLLIAWWLGASTTWLLVIGGFFFFIIIIMMVFVFSEPAKKVVMPATISTPATVVVHNTPPEQPPSNIIHHYHTTNVMHSSPELEQVEAQNIPIATSPGASLRPEYRSMPEGARFVTNQQLGTHKLNPDPTLKTYIQTGGSYRDTYVDSQGNVVNAVLSKPTVAQTVYENKPPMSVMPYMGGLIQPGMRLYTSQQTGEKFVGYPA